MNSKMMIASVVGALVLAGCAHMAKQQARPAEEARMMSKQPAQATKMKTAEPVRKTQQAKPKAAPKK